MEKQEKPNSAQPEIIGIKESGSFSLSENLRKEKREKGDKYSSTFPSPRTVEQQKLILPSEAEALIPQYREQIISHYEKLGKEGTLTEDRVQELQSSVIIAKEGQEEMLLSTLCSNYSGVTMEKVLRFIPEELHRLNKGLRTLSDGRAYGSESLQLSLFTEIEQKGLEQSRKKGAPILKYNVREWAKVICGTTNPKRKQIEYVERAIDYLCKFRIYYPLGDGRFYFNTLLRRGNEGVIGGKGGESYEYIQVAPFFAFALTEGKRGALQADTEIVWKLSLTRINEILSTKMDYRLLNYLEYIYSFARSDIKAKAKRGEVELHTENIQKLLQMVASGAYIKEYKAEDKKYRTGGNKAKALKELRSSLSKMEVLGIIKEGTIKEEKGSIIWGWGTL